MLKLEIQKAYKEVEINGTIYKLEVPALRQEMQFAAIVKNSNDFQPYVDFLVGQGLPEEIIWQFSQDQLIEILKYLSEKKN